MNVVAPVRIGVDIDGVLADFNSAYSKRLGLELPPGGPTAWDYHLTMGVDPAVYTREWERLNQDHQFWATLPSYPHTAEAIQWLQDMRTAGQAVYFITSRPGGPRMKLAAEAWLRKHGFAVPTVLMSEDKGLLAAGLGLTHFVDDKPLNCLQVVRAMDFVNGCEVTLLDQPYNRDFAHPAVKRVPGLNDYLASVYLSGVADVATA